MPDYPDYQTTAVAEFMAKARQPMPLWPTIPPLEVRKLRARLILEEAFETINKGLGLAIDLVGDDIIEFSYISIGDIQFNVDGIRVPNMIELADGCADLKVVTVGTELACGVNGRPVFDEVMRSNMTKDFENSNGAIKVQKGANYEPPNIERVLREQGWKP